MDEGEFDSAKEKAGKVIKIENGSSALIKKSEEILTSIEESESEVTLVTEDYEAALKLYEDKKYEKAETAVDDILKQDLEQPIFESIKKKSEELKKDIESALAEDKKAEEESAQKEEQEADKEKVEQERIAKDKAEKQESENNTESNKSTDDDKEIFYERGYPVYYDEYDMMIDAETDEAVFSNHPMFEKENVEDVLSFIEYSYEPGMIKDELKNKINETSELSYEIISKTVDTYWSENF